MEAVAMYSYDTGCDDELGFKKGNVIKILNTDSDEDWLQAELNGRRGVVPSNYIQIKPHMWFVSKLKRQDAETRLLKEPDGAFLVRLSEMEPGGFSLSVKYQNRVQHFRILRNSDGKYFLWEKKFTSLNELIAHHRQNSVSRTQFIILTGHQDKNNTMVTALHDFEPKESDEIRLKKGDVIQVTNSSDEDWWIGVVNGKSGAFPRNYVQLIND